MMKYNIFVLSFQAFEFITIVRCINHINKSRHTKVYEYGVQMLYISTT